MDAQDPGQLPRERLRQVFEFLKAYVDLRYPLVRDINRELRVLWLKDLPEHPSIELRAGHGSAEIESDESDIILRLARPTLTSCPSPPAMIAEWLTPGWQEIDANPAVRPSRNWPNKDGTVRFERFEDSPQRPLVFGQWKEQRNKWQVNEQPARNSLNLFQRVYEWFGIQEREAERIEIMLGDGLLHCADENGTFDHPVLLQRLELEFDPEKRPPQFVFRKGNRPPELYLEFLRTLPGVDHRQIARCADELRTLELSPIGRGDTEGFLRRLIQGVFPTGGELLAQAEQPRGTSPYLRRDPVIFVRERRSGIGNVFDLVLEDIASREDFPAALLQIVWPTGNVSSAIGEKSSPTSFANEDEDILLSKPANKEQLEIARQLARRDCVLVQGPPGTGKTHTIANLLGHLLSEGKRVLVTAQTPKALRVLRQKVVEPLQPLCISVLQNDRQSQEELQDSIRQINVRLSQDDQRLVREGELLKRDRKKIISQLREVRARLLDARQDETRSIVFGGTAMRPIDAANRVRQGVGVNDWIPSPVQLGEVLPLSHAEIATLYQTNSLLSAEDERELNGWRPDAAPLPSPKQFEDLVEEMAALRSQDLNHREELWDLTKSTRDLSEFDRMLESASKAMEFMRDAAPWQLEAVQAGRDGDEATKVWTSLMEMIEAVWREVQEYHALVVRYGPTIKDARPPHELLPVVDEIIEHIESGKSFNLLTKLTKSDCHQVIDCVQIGSRAPNLKNSAEFRSVRALLRTQTRRQDLVERWERLMTKQGGPAVAELSDKPERVCREFVPLIQASLSWHRSTWLTLESEFQRLGFRWPEYIKSTPPETGANAGLRRLRKAVLGDLEHILKMRTGKLRLERLENMWREWCAVIPSPTEAEAGVTQRLRQALVEASPAAYQLAYRELSRLKSLEPDLVTRRTLLDRLGRCGPAWASSIQNRHPQHSKPDPPGDPITAWEWRQLQDELERRASVSLDELQQRIEHLNTELLSVTASLIEKRTWMNTIRQTTHEQKHALGAYAAMRKKLTKTGRGVQDPAMRAGARREMGTAKGAVPVWIMPLNEVAEAFDPRTTRFDVVIIDEASQCSPTAMFALYLGRQTVIVGDDEQVTPVSVGVNMAQVQKLIQVHLRDIPHNELYDGEFSIYEFAQVAFGGVIRLVEHFRCAPDIIAFSNALSYKGEIKPLREASSIRLTPHVLPYRVEAVRGRYEDSNEAEAETIASLICAAIELPEYATNEEGNPMSFGVVSLVGNIQAMKVDSILRERLEPAEFKRRQILCGDSAQFQGDERDVMFLSIVDSPPADPPLPMRQEGPKNIFKKRYNVAASRARDQMWVVHSLNHEVDLKPGDYRRRLIEHALDPGAWERELERLLQRTDPRSEVFEPRVLRLLVDRGYKVLPQYRVGSYWIDLVVIGGGKRLAIECDGEKWHGPEKLQEDMDRQSALERLGWKFVRIRGSNFFRDEEKAMQPVFRRLEELGITPDAKFSGAKEPASAGATVQTLIRCAQDIRASWHRAEPSAEAARQSGMPRTPSIITPHDILRGGTESVEIPAVKTPTAKFSDSVGSATVGTLVQTPQGGTVTARTSQDISDEDSEDERALEELRKLVQEEKRASGGSVSLRNAVRLIRPAAPYRDWTPRALADPRSSKEDQIVAGLIEIIGVEGPMPCHRAYRIYARAVGILDDNRQVRRVFNRAISKALRNGQLEQRNEYGTNDQINKIVRLRGTPVVVLRARGNRSFVEIPPSEIASVMNSLLKENPNLGEESIFASVQQHYEVASLTHELRERLRWIRAHFSLDTPAQ